MFKSWLFWVGVILIVVALTYDQYVIRKLTRYKQISDVALMVQSDSAKQLVTKNGEIYAQVKSLIIDKASLRGTLEAMGIKIKDLAKKNINYKNIVSILQSELKASGHDTIRLRDTIIINKGFPPIKGQEYHWTNNNLTLWGTIQGYNMDNNYVYKVGILSTTEQYAKKSLVNISLSDPHAVILTGSQITINKDPVKWWNHWYYYVIEGFLVKQYIFK